MSRPEPAEPGSGLRLCYVTPIPPHRYSGANFHAVWLAGKLAELGVTIEFVTFSEGDGGPSVVGDGFPCHHLQRRFGRHAELAVWPQLAGFLRRRRFDVVHVHSTGYLGSFAGAAAQLAGSGAVATIMREGGLVAREGRVTPALHRALLRTFDRIVAISEETREEALRAGLAASSLARIPIGVDVDRFRPPSVAERRRFRDRFDLPWDVPVVACVAALSHRKNILWLLDAWLGPTAPAPEAHLLLVGDAANDPEGPAVREEVKARVEGARRPVRWIPFVPEIEQIYGLSDVLVLPSLREGMPTVVLQAMASGLPVVSTPVSGVPELLGADGERGRVYPFDDEGRFREAVETLLRDGDRRRATIRAARAHAEGRFSLEAVARAHVRLYLAVAARGAAESHLRSRSRGAAAAASVRGMKAGRVQR